jgi:hypothetical protein
VARLDAPNIREFDAFQIVYFLVDQQNIRKNNQPSAITAEVGESLVNQKCTTCHELDRVHQAKKNEKGWEDTVNRMSEYGGDGFLTKDQAQEIITYLSGR